MHGLLKINQQGKHESARIRVENIIRSDLTTELHEILELYCELLLARAGLLDGSTPDPGLEEAIVSILYATPRTEIKELINVRNLLVEKYGREYALGASEDREGIVPDRVKKKMRVEPPSQNLVESYLKAIASTYGISYGDDEEEEEEEEDDEGGGGGGQGQAKRAQSEPADLEPPLTADTLKEMSPPPENPGSKSPLSIAPPSPSTDNTNPRLRLPGPPDLKPNAKMKKAHKDTSSKTDINGNAKSADDKPAGKVPEVDDLERRFAMLKR